MNNEDLVYHIDTLEKKLKDSEESNEELQFQLDELGIMMDNLEKTAHLEKKEHDYSYLREELELLKGCLKLSKGRERMLELRVEGLEDNCTTSRNHNFKITAEVSSRELIETKTTSELQASVHDATTESKHREAVRRLENEMENLQLKLTENNDLLTNMEAQFMLKQSLFEEELQNAEILFNQKNFSLQERETKLQVLRLAFANTEKKHQDTIEQLQGERERLQMLLTDQSNTLEQKERELQVLTSSLACAKQSHEHGMKQKQIDLERMQRCLNEKTHALEETQKNLMAVSATVDEIRKEAVVKLQEELNSTQSALGDKEQTLMRIGNEGIVQQLENDVKRLQELLREKQLELDKMEVNLQLKESKLLVLTEELRSTQREFSYGDRDVSAGPLTMMWNPSDANGRDIQEKTKDVSSEFSSGSMAYKNTPRVTFKTQISKKSRNGSKSSWNPGIATRIRRFFTQNKTEKSSVARQQCCRTYEDI